MKPELPFGLYLTVFMFGVASTTEIAVVMCSQPMDSGTGEQMNLQFYYDTTKGHCLPFHYKGEGGNSNRFDTEVSCTRNCSDKHVELYPHGAEVCSLTVSQGMCFARLVMFYYNQEEKACRTFIYGGCGGNGNRFHTKEECQLMCAKSGRQLGSSGDEPNPDAPAANIGLIAGIVGGCVFAVAVISLTVFLFMQRNSKTRGRKKVPTSAIEVEMQ